MTLGILELVCAVGRIAPAVPGLLMAFLAYGRMVLKPVV
jgi:hypothetical protein